MSHRILITGASGYLGGDLLAQLARTSIPETNTVFALVRNDKQAEAVKKHGATPLTFNVRDQHDVLKAVLEHKISVVFFLIDAYEHFGQVNFIHALGELKRRTGKDVHFLHTTGAKLFSSHAGAPTDRVIYDDEEELYELQLEQAKRESVMQKGVVTNNTVIEQAQKEGVRSYIFAPCIVYGKGEGFGNPISIQTVDIVKAAKGAGKLYSVTKGNPTWPVCHISDNSALYIKILEAIIGGNAVGHGQNGYYLAASGSIAWNDLYAAMGKGLKARGVVDDDAVTQADEAALAKMAEGLGTKSELVEFNMAGKCTFTARHGHKIGWTAKYAPEHILEAADAEVELILATLYK